MLLASVAAGQSMCLFPDCVRMIGNTEPDLSARWLDSDPVVNGRPNPLLTISSHSSHCLPYGENDSFFVPLGAKAFKRDVQRGREILGHRALCSGNQR